jgi:hypothetical protein
MAWSDSRIEVSLGKVRSFLLLSKIKAALMSIKISPSFFLRITIFHTILCVMLQSCGQKEEFTQSESLPAGPIFKLRKTVETGVDFNNIITEDRNRNIIRYQGYYDGGGVAAADFNNDGLIDLYFTANMHPNKFYINKGNFRVRRSDRSIRSEGDWFWLVHWRHRRGHQQ